MMSGAALAVDCPAGAPSCKVIVLTPIEEEALVRQNGIFDTAEKARFLDLSALVNYFRQKIEKAPPGEVKAEPEKK